MKRFRAPINIMLYPLGLQPSALLTLNHYVEADTLEGAKQMAKEAEEMRQDLLKNAPPHALISLLREECRTGKKWMECLMPCP